MIFIRDIQAATAQHYAIPVAAMSSREQVRQFARPRQVAMALSRRLTDHSTVTIGRIFNRDHSTIITGAQAAERRCGANDETKTAMRRITLELVRH